MKKNGKAKVAVSSDSSRQFRRHPIIWRTSTQAAQASADFLLGWRRNAMSERLRFSSVNFFNWICVENFEKSSFWFIFQNINNVLGHGQYIWAGPVKGISSFLLQLVLNYVRLLNQSVPPEPGNQPLDFTTTLESAFFHGKKIVLMPSNLPPMKSRRHKITPLGRIFDWN
jgi:hypothetical protein